MTGRGSGSKQGDVGPIFAGRDRLGSEPTVQKQKLNCQHGFKET